MPHEYDFITWLRGLSEAQKRADEKALKTQEGDPSICSASRWLDNLSLRNSERNVGEPPKPVVNEDSAGDNLRSLLEFLGED